MSPGQVLGLLGAGETSETDGQRKHLHLGIHLGSQIELRGYVESSAQLTNWLDPQSILSLD